MPKIQRSALVNHSAEQMFDLVNDIEAYPRFMPGCQRARILEKTDEALVGEQQLGAAGVEQRFTTRNSLERPNRISMVLVEGNFRDFAATWTFEPLGEDACKVALNMHFEFKKGLLGLAASTLFSTMANAQVDATVKRADQLYGG